MTGFIYVVGDDYLVKIGWSKTPNIRYSKIKSDSPVDCRLWGVIDGSRQDEAQLHKRFQEQHLRGEWFFNDGSVAEFVKTLLPAKIGKKTIDYMRAFKAMPVEKKAVDLPVISLDLTIQPDIAGIETRLQTAGYTVGEMLRVAGVNKSQWTRYKRHGQEPQLSTWRKITAAVDRLAPNGSRRRSA